jgi:RNA polymerase sigma-70 factor (ECF subfamily)
MADAPGAPDDAALVDAVAGRSQAALADLYRRYGGAVHGHARRVCRNPQMAEEICQVVFAELWSRPGRFDAERGTLRTWLLTQAHSRAVDMVRAESARRRRDEMDAQLHPSATGAGEVEASVQSAALADDVRRAVDRLPDDERAAILLAYVGGHSYRKTASLLGAPEGTVKSRIRTGLTRLRDILDAEGVTP